MARPSMGDATRCVWSSSKLTRPGSEIDDAPDPSWIVSILMKSCGAWFGSYRMKSWGFSPEPPLSVSP